MTNRGPDDETVPIDAILDGKPVDRGQQVTRLDGTRVQPAATVLRPTGTTQPIRKRRRGPSRRARVTIVCFCVVALAACAALVFWKWYLPRHHHPAGNQPSSSSSHIKPGTVTTESPSSSATPTKASASPTAKATVSPPAKLPPDLQPLQAGINSSSLSAQAAVVIPRERASISQGQHLLPPGHKLTIDPGTLKLVNNNEHVATVVATDSHGQKYQLGLYRKDSNHPWLLAISKELP